jgi:hypothetical protein
MFRERRESSNERSKIKKEFKLKSALESPMLLCDILSLSRSLARSLRRHANATTSSRKMRKEEEGKKFFSKAAIMPNEWQYIEFFLSSLSLALVAPKAFFLPLACGLT